MQNTEIRNGQKPCVLKGTIVSFEPASNPPVSDYPLYHMEKGAVAVSCDGRIEWRGAASELPDTYANYSVEDHGDNLIMAGFIDTHVHFPQYRMLAASADGLLDWLERYTFPEELQYCSKEYASKAAKKFLASLFRNGTTSALAFATVHPASAEALFEAAFSVNMGMITGKTMMDQSAPAGLTDDAETSAEECQKLINDWHGKARLQYAVTPRFAITSTEAQLTNAGKLLQENKSCLMQTHLSESLGEIATVGDMFPNAKDYTDVYDRFGLVTDRSIFAHGIHLSQRELGRLSEAGSSIIHCPTSNTFLGSGLFDMASMKSGSRPVRFGLATDIGAGTSYSMLATMAEAYKVAMLKGYKLSAREAFYTATLGNAYALKLEAETGSIDPGKWADIIVVDPKATETLASRMELSASIDDVLFALMMLGDDRTIKATYVAGKAVHTNTA